MLGTTHRKYGALELEQFLPKGAHEQGGSIEYNVCWNAMQANHFLYEDHISLRGIKLWT